MTGRPAEAASTPPSSSTTGLQPVASHGLAWLAAVDLDREAADRGGKRRQRRELHQALVQVFGAERAEVLMEHLPPTGWGDVARRSDVDHAVAMMRCEMAVLGSELRVEMAALRSEMSSGFERQTRLFLTTFLTTFGAFTALVVGLGH